MAEFFVAMLFGTALFCGGILFERYFGVCSEEENDADGWNDEATVDSRYLKQWENLLNYDGSRQEEKNED